MNRFGNRVIKWIYIHKYMNIYTSLEIMACLSYDDIDTHI